MDLCKNQTLKEIVRRRNKLTEFEAGYYINQLLNGLMQVHSHKVVHRDLKLGNLLIDENLQVKIGDFGLAKAIHKERATTLCGTPNYISPEVLAKTGHSFEADIWAVGIIAYTMIFGSPPFEGQEVKDTYKNIKNCNYHFNDNSHISKEAKTFIRSILVLNPQKRPSIKDLK